MGPLSGGLLFWHPLFRRAPFGAPLWRRCYLGRTKLRNGSLKIRQSQDHGQKLSIGNATIPEANLTAQMAGIQCFAEKAPRQCFPPRLKPPSPLSRRVVGKGKGNRHFSISVNLFFLHFDLYSSTIMLRY